MSPPLTAMRCATLGKRASIHPIEQGCGQTLRRSGVRIHTTLACFLACLLALLPTLACAQLSIWLRCKETNAAAEGRTIYVGEMLKANTRGMYIKDLEDMYCVTPVKCVAMGLCKASSPQEQAAADKLKRDMAGEEARLESERRRKAEQAAQREREDERQHREDERKRKETAATDEKLRREQAAAAEARRLGLNALDARIVADAREAARNKMPPQPEKCTLDIPASTREIDFSTVMLLQARSEKEYAATNRSRMCGGHPGTLGPLECEKPTDFFGARIGACKAVLQCPARQETRQCVRATAQ
jgi:hypothetical protein